MKNVYDFRIGKNGDTPLLNAVRHGFVGEVKRLLAGGADEKIKDYNGQSAMALAINTGNLELIKILQNVEHWRPVYH